MTEEEKPDELELEEEVEDTPLVEFEITVSPSDPSLELLVQQFARGDIIIPFYQRNFVWKIEQSSKLIESFLMGLPVPQIFLYVNDDNQLEVIDGQQRLRSIYYFFEGYFGDPDTKGYRQIFKLKGLSERSEYNGKSFSELSVRDQRRLRNSTLRAINVKQLRPSIANDSVFHIFERLNTGGTHLRPQEIRNAVFRGKIVDELQELNKNKDWQAILGLSRPDKSQKDVELVLRLFALFKNWKNYEKPMLQFLNRFMKSNRKFDDRVAVEFRERFPKASALIYKALGRTFRPRGALNSAVLEAIFVSVLEDPSIDEEDLKKKYTILLADSDFDSRTRGGTTDTNMVQSRIRLAKQKLAHAKN
jgi:uncharacterized protein with ParB-like and HNH nuclease domain